MALAGDEESHKSTQLSDIRDVANLDNKSHSVKRWGNPKRDRLFLSYRTRERRGFEATVE